MCLSFRDLEDQVEKLRERLTEASEGENWGRSEQEDATECQYQVTMVVVVKSVNHSSLSRHKDVHSPSQVSASTNSFTVGEKQTKIPQH